MTHIIEREELPHSGSAHTFEAYRYGDANVSLFLSETPPGRGPELHARPYGEVFVAQDGELTFTVGDDTVEATGGEIPAGVPHRFVNPGTDPSRHIGIRASRRVITDSLENRGTGEEG